MVIAFGLISPWLLLGGLLLSAAPIIIHLLHRRRHRERPWAAMQFLRAALRKQARRLRLESLILLAVRVLLIACAAAALAQPFLNTPAGGSAAGTGRRHHVLVLDGSLSMQAGAGTESAFDTARALALRIVESANPGDAFHLLRISRSSPQWIISDPAFDPDIVRREVESLTATEERGDPTGALRRMLPHLSARADGDRTTVYLISDFQQTDWLPAEEPVRDELRALFRGVAGRSELVLVDIGRDRTANAIVLDARFVLGPSSGEASGEVEATVHNFGRTPLADLAVELRINERLRETQIVTVPSRTSVAVRFAGPGAAGRESVAEIRIADDVLLPDNRRWVVLPAAEPLEVLIVDGQPQTGGQRRAAHFLATALAPRSLSAGSAATLEQRGPMHPTVIADGELATRDLARFDCVYLCNVALVGAGEAARLYEFVEAGGGLVITVGEQVRPASYHEMLDRDGQRLLPARLLETVAAGDDEQGFRFDPGNYEEPIVQAFAGNDDAGLLTTRIHRYYRVEPAASARVLLRFANGDPAIVEQRVGAGRVLLVTTPLDDRWGNWALWPSFLPMMHELTRFACTADLDDRRLTVGETIVHRYLPEQFGRAVTLAAPGADPVTLRRPDAAQHQFVSEPLLRSGPYELQIGASDPVIRNYAVNIDPLEGDLAALDEATIASELLPDLEYRYVRDWTPTSSNALDYRPGRADLTMWFLLAAAALLLIEQAMAWNFRFGALLLALIVTGALVSGAGVRGLLGAALLLALVLVLSARRRAAVKRHPAV